MGSFSFGDIWKAFDWVLNRNLEAGVIYYTYRCFGLGLGPRACRRLLQGVAKLTGGTTEYLDDEDRLQPKVVYNNTSTPWIKDELQSSIKRMQPH